jgi:DNA primase small subunit
LPNVIHIGPICETNTKSDIKGRELVFDIDLNEYVDSNRKSIRGCCGTSDSCCEKCWELALIAKVIINEILKKFMGFKKVKFFFSGRRGMHCWVLDPECKPLSREERAAILKRFNSIKKIPKSLEMKSIVQKFKKNYLLGVLKSLGCDLGKQDSKYDLVSFLWPRFDSGPTEELSHPVKSPFALHKQTLKIANQMK